MNYTQNEKIEQVKESTLVLELISEVLNIMSEHLITGEES